MSHEPVYSEIIIFWMRCINLWHPPPPTNKRRQCHATKPMHDLYDQTTCLKPRVLTPYSMCKKQRLAYNSSSGCCPACHASCFGAPAKGIFPIVRTMKTKILGLSSYFGSVFGSVFFGPKLSLILRLGFLVGTWGGGVGPLGRGTRAPLGSGTRIFWLVEPGVPGVVLRGPGEADHDGVGDSRGGFEREGEGEGLEREGD